MIIILSVIFILLFASVIIYTNKIRANAYNKLLKETDCVFTACAGSDKDDIIIPDKINVKALRTSEFKDSKGNTLNPENYLQFIVQGESMQFCGIHNNDLIFADHNFEITANTHYPVALVLRKYQLKEDETQFKIRRTWKCCTLIDEDKLKQDLADIIKSDSFQKIRQLPIYDGDNTLIDDALYKRYPDYLVKNGHGANLSNRQIVISTTYHTDTKELRFSLHPVSHIVGKVIASFPYATLEGE